MTGVTHSDEATENFKLNLYLPLAFTEFYSESIVS